MANQTSIDLAVLPRWNLTRHFGYSDPFDKKIDQDIEKLDGLCKEFQKSYEGCLDKKLYQAIVEYEKIKMISSRISGYIHLAYTTAQDDSSIMKRQSAIDAQTYEIFGNSLTFFSLEIADLPENNITSQYESSPDLLKYQPYIKKLRKRKPYMLDKAIERALTVRSPWSGSDTVSSYFEKQLSNAKFKYMNEEYNLETLLNKLRDPDPTVRRAALKAIDAGFRENAIDNFSTLSLNMVAGDWHIENVERGFKTVRSSRNLHNNIDDETVDSLLRGVRTAGVEMTKRYYALKKRLVKSMQGVEVFTWADRNAPINFDTKEDLMPWDEAVKLVDAGFMKFSPTMAKLFRQMLEEQRLDVPSMPGKVGGAFCAGNTPDIGPYQLHNYVGSKRDVATLAHESGHGCHDLLAYKHGVLQYHPPMTLAEVASVFSEMVVFKDLISRTTTPKERLTLLMEKIDDILNTVVRQCSFDYFEEMVHTARKDGVLSTEELSKMYMKSTMEYYGKEGEIFDKYEHMDVLWSYVSHFHAYPFYVYAYAFAELVVGALYNVYQKQPEGFEPKLLELLAAGGTKSFIDALAPFGLNPHEDSFWAEALETHLGTMLTEAEEIVKSLGM